jgi:hypothetical protein
MKGTPNRHKKEFWNCKCGTEFLREVRIGHRKELCERCEANRKYQLKRRKM